MNVKINAIDYSVENASTVFEAASAAGVVAREHIAAKVNGVVSAMSAPIKEGDEIEILNFAEAVAKKDEAVLVNKTNGKTAKLKLTLSARQRAILLAGGRLNYTKQEKQ